MVVDADADAVTAPPLTLTAKPFLASVSTLPSVTGIEFPTDIFSLPASFSPLWLHRPAPPYCGASHTNDRKATGSCLQRPLPPFGGTSQLLVVGPGAPGPGWCMLTSTSWMTSREI